jgi:hypothetical protein
MSNPRSTETHEAPKTTARWRGRGLAARLALAFAVPPLVAGLVASFLPWPELRWILFAAVWLPLAIAMWVWIHVTVVRRLRSVARALGPGRSIHDLEPGGGLSGIVEALSAQLARERELKRSFERFELVRLALARLTETAAQWADTERTPEFLSLKAPTSPEEVTPLVERLALAASRIEERIAAARAVSMQVRETVAETANRAAAVAGAAERQFVDATTLLTVLRESQRSGGDLGTGLDGLGGALEAQSLAMIRAREATEVALRGAVTQLEAVVRASGFVRSAVRDLERVHEQTQLAAVESAHSALGVMAGEVDLIRLTEALATLVQETRAASTRARELEQAIEAELARSHENLGALMVRLNGGEADAMVQPREAMAPPRRALDRMSEMNREAIARGEKLVQQAERTSSEAHRVGEGLGSAIDEVDGLAARLAERAPTGDSPGPAPGNTFTRISVLLEAGSEADDESAGESTEGPQGPLRVLGPEDLLPDDENWSHG